MEKTATVIITNIVLLLYKLFYGQSELFLNSTMKKPLGSIYVLKEFLPGFSTLITLWKLTMKQWACFLLEPATFANEFMKTTILYASSYRVL